MSFNVNRAASALTTGVQNASASVQVRHSTQIDDRFARVVCTASASATPAQIVEGIKNQFKGATPILGSFTSLASNKALQVFEGIVGIVQNRIVLNDENRDQYKAVASNIFMSADETLWALRQTDTGQVLIKASDSEADRVVMKHLMACASNSVNDFDMRDIGQDTAEMRATVKGGDWIHYVSQASADVQSGIATVAIDNADGSDTFTLQVVRPTGESETIHRDMIVASAEVETDPEDEKDAEVAIASGAVDISRFNSYYARMFARRPAYFDMFMQRVRSYVFF